MPTRDRAPVGSPCWADLWTSDVEASRRFYAELFGWQAEEPDPQFGGYFLFTRAGVPVAGAMGDMPGMAATDTWKIYLATDDITKTLATAEAEGAQVVNGELAVADLGVQAYLTDPAGAAVGVWQPGTFQGFSVLGEHDTPSWFELHTPDHTGSLAFYRSVFGWDTSSVSDTDEFRYATVRDPSGGEDVAGVMDARAWLGGAPAYWSVYWHVGDVDTAVATLTALGGSVVDAAQDTPYGRLATAADPAGARFKLRTPPAR